MSHDDDPPDFKDAESEARYWKSLVYDLRDQLDADRDELKAGAKELESALQEELEAAERELRAANERLRADLDDSKARHQAALREHANTLSHMQRELEQIRKVEADLRLKVRDMEVDNDDLEKSDRAKSSTLADLETQRARDIERIALLEEELVTKARLEEEVQRFKDELRDAEQELSVLRQQRAALPPAPARPLTPPGGDFAEPGASIGPDAPLSPPASATDAADATPRKLTDVKRLSGLTSPVIFSRIPSPRKSLTGLNAVPLSPTLLSESLRSNGPASRPAALPSPRKAHERGAVANEFKGLKERLVAGRQARQASHLPVMSALPTSVSRYRRVSNAGATPPALASSRAGYSSGITRSATRSSLISSRAQKVTPPSMGYSRGVIDESPPDESPLSTRADYPRRPPSRISGISTASSSRPATPTGIPMSSYRSPTPSSAMFSARPPSSMGRPPSSLGRPSSAMASARRKSMMPPLPTSNGRPKSMADPSMGASTRRVSMRSAGDGAKSPTPGTRVEQPRWR